MSRDLRLGVNIDHVATVRNARGAGYPDPVRAALVAAAAGADGITAHLREDRRHITDDDIAIPRSTTVPIGHSGDKHINVYGWDPGSSSAIVTATFTFRDAGEATLQVKVVPARDEYAGIVPVPSAAPSP